MHALISSYVYINQTNWSIFSTFDNKDVSPASHPHAVASKKKKIFHFVLVKKKTEEKWKNKHLKVILYIVHCTLLDHFCIISLSPSVPQQEGNNNLLNFIDNHTQTDLFTSRYLFLLHIRMVHWKTIYVALLWFVNCCKSCNMFCRQ